ncbi:MAG: GspE/PulE family protein [Dissulfurispiraceae bacterium]|jgi:type II secretory ATPase GspE/PulE/Tfp pilus assembly ATPase PilB-like protein
MATAVRVGDLLLAKGFLDSRQLNIALIQQQVTGDMLGDTLVKFGFVTSAELAQSLAEQSGMEYIDLNSFVISEDALKIIPKELAEKIGFVPLDIEKGMLSIGVDNPSNVLAIDTVTKMTGQAPKVYIVDADSFRGSLERAYFFLQNPIRDRMDAIINEIKATGTASGNAVTGLNDLILMDGIRKNATDIHINPTASVLQVFYRIDGVLQYGHCIPGAAHNGIISRIKILSRLDIAEQRLPQDGSFRFSVLNKHYDIRVSTVPTVYGENVVMRVLAGSASLLRIDKLGFDKANTTRIKMLFQKSSGIILITGPTGSGKTTTLYAALREIDLIERNVITVEDPVEYKLSLIKQTQVNEKVGYDFAIAGRNFMRQDPDVMLLGEVRDEETAKIAIRASITGHLVLSTLHTNDAVTAIPRLLDLNVDRFLMSSSLLAVMAQRLIRKICVYCKKEYTPDEEEIAKFKEAGVTLTTAFKGSGCNKCNNTGYAGRTVVGEILIVDDDIREMIYSGSSITSLKAMAVKKGMVPLKDLALRKAAEGITSFDEVMRVAG